MRLIVALILLLLLQSGCLKNGSTVEMLGSRSMFVGPEAVDQRAPGEFVLAIVLTPTEHRDAVKMCKLLRSGHPVLLRIREEPNQPPILVSSVTDDGKAIILCKTVAEANHVIGRLDVGPVRH